MEALKFTQEQIKTIIEQLTKENGKDYALKIALETIMKAERQIHNEYNNDVSNGFRTRNMLGEGRILELKVPRTRNGGFYPKLLVILKEQHKEMMNLANLLYLKGLTNQDISEIFEYLYGEQYSRQRINQMIMLVREDIEMWKNRQLDSYYPVIFIDALYQYTKIGESVKLLSYYTILGLKEDFSREVLLSEAFPTENSLCWEQLLNSLKERGVQKVNLVVSDALTAIEKAVSKVFMCEHQFCTVHLKRNITNEVLPKDKNIIKEQLKEVFKTDIVDDTPQKGWQRWLDFLDLWIKTYPSFKKYKNQRYRLYFTYLDYDYRIRSMIYSTNWIERLNSKFRRVLKIRATMPSTESVLSLIIGVAVNMKAYQYKITKFKYETKKFVKNV